MERDSFEHSCHASSNFVFQFLNFTLQNSGTNIKIHQGVFRCVTAWIYTPKNQRGEPYLSPRLPPDQLLSVASQVSCFVCLWSAFERFVSRLASCSERCSRMRDVKG